MRLMCLPQVIVNESQIPLQHGQPFMPHECCYLAQGMKKRPCDLVSARAHVRIPVGAQVPKPLVRLPGGCSRIHPVFFCSGLTLHRFCETVKSRYTA